MIHFENTRKNQQRRWLYVLRGSPPLPWSLQCLATLQEERGGSDWLNGCNNMVVARETPQHSPFFMSLFTKPEGMAGRLGRRLFLPFFSPFCNDSFHLAFCCKCAFCFVFYLPISLAVVFAVKERKVICLLLIRFSLRLRDCKNQSIVLGLKKINYILT